MQWQDWVFSVGGFVLLASLVPTIRGDQKPALTTSVMSAVLIGTFGVTMASLGLWLSAVANVANGLAWAVLAVQRYTMMKRLRAEGVIDQIEEELEDVVHHHEEPDPPVPATPTSPEVRSA